LSEPVYLEIASGMSEARHAREWWRVTAAVIALVLGVVGLHL
jgi:hypothetical protein